MSTYHSFDQKAIEEALEAGSRVNEGKELDATSSNYDGNLAGHVSMSASCIGLTVSNHKVCVELPLHFGKHCIPVPARFPDGTPAQACLDICHHWRVPTGVKVTINIDGVQVASATFGDC